MVGAPDRLAEHGHASDAVRPSEDRDLRADLRERLERLPHGHPSSPYEHDGTAKPPVPNLAEHERPIPDDHIQGTDRNGDSTFEEPTYSPAEDFQGLRADDREAEVTHGALKLDDAPIIGQDGSWEWKGRYLTPEQSRIADRALERFRIAEGRDETGAYGDHGITPAMRRIESQLENGRLVDRTEEFALKSADRFKEKVANQLIRLPGADPGEMAREIHDAVRYTFTFDTEDYHDGVWGTEQRLATEGFELEVRRNLWGCLEYKGINTRWRDPSTDVPFEVQFHTEASWLAKQETHIAYERIADTRVSPDERERLRAYQSQISGKLELPPKALEIQDYRKEGF